MPPATEESIDALATLNDAAHHVLWGVAKVICFPGGSYPFPPGKQIGGCSRRFKDAVDAPGRNLALTGETQQGGSDALRGRYLPQLLCLGAMPPGCVQ